MIDDKRVTTDKQIKSVTKLSIICNIFLAIFKLFIGWIANSISLIADGIHSFSDLTTDIAVLLGVRIGSKEADSSHPYGHGRAETFATGAIALFLFSIGGAMIYYAATNIAKSRIVQPGFIVLIAASISIIVKEILYHITKKTAVKSHSSMLYANAWHQRSDALSSVAVLAGFIAMKFGFEYGDQIAAIAVGLMILFVAAQIIGDCLRELTEAAVDTDTIEQIENIINSIEQIRGWHKLRTRTVGRELFLDFHILVDAELNIKAAHEITERLESILQENIPQPVNIIVHIEPDTQEMKM